MFTPPSRIVRLPPMIKAHRQQSLNKSLRAQCTSNSKGGSVQAFVLSSTFFLLFFAHANNSRRLPRKHYQVFKPTRRPHQHAVRILTTLTAALTSSRVREPTQHTDASNTTQTKQRTARCIFTATPFIAFSTLLTFSAKRIYHDGRLR